MDNWISVEERLPEEGVPVLAMEMQGAVALFVATKLASGWYEQGAVWWRCGKYVTNSTWHTVVTHWQPLPEPPTPPRSNATEAEGW